MPVWLFLSWYERWVDVASGSEQWIGVGIQIVEMGRPRLENFPFGW